MLAWRLKREGGVGSEERKTMSIRRVNGVYVADTARVLGEVELGRDVSIWYGAVIRGDVAKITIGAGTNVQDSAVVHCDSGVANTIGSDVTIGHGAVVHGCEVGEGTLIGMGAIVLGRSVIGRGCLIAAGALVSPGMRVADGMMVIGVPGRVLRETTEEERKYLGWLPAHYVKLARLHVEEPGNARVRGWGVVG
jgi:carbonic anhydrase/acetyltransferase-like protein (isoleucine patch superfamily)